MDEQRLAEHGADRTEQRGVEPQRVARGSVGPSDFDDAEYEPLGRQRQGLSKLLVTMVAVLALLGILVAGSLVWLTSQINPDGPVGEPVGSLVIPRESSLDDVANLLAENDVVTSAAAFRWYSRFKNVGVPNAGEYVQFRENSAMADVIDVLADGPIAPESIPLTIIPGMWLTDALERIAETFPGIERSDLDEALASGQVVSQYRPADATSWEGFLLPETWEFNSSATAVEVLQRVVDETDSTLDALGYGNAESLTGYNAYDVLTVASMIEREKGDVAGEGNKIAQVIYNRLDSGTPLGIDATILYGLGRKGGTDDPLTKSDLEQDTPYNSRLNSGLPPTPIALASEASLEAAMNPAEGPWTYYVLVNDSPREHLFTDSAAEFERAKAESREKGLT